MEKLNLYKKAFAETFGVAEAEVEKLEYQGIQAWDSVGHMQLIAAIEDAFDIVLDTDDIVVFSSFEKGKEILAKYNVFFD